MTTSTTEVLLIADTHLRRGAAGVLTSKIEEHLAGADAVLHAGDITDCSVIEALREMAPHADVHAVAGNLDHGLNLPDRLVLDIDGCAVALVHDSGPATGRRRRLRRWFPDSDLVVFGHSHVPWHEVDVRPSDHHRQHQVNPGSAMLRRRSPTCTIALVVLAVGRVVQVRQVPIA
jgi:putative phosphoesterase